jgi:hypothetical protein
MTPEDIRQSHIRHGTLAQLHRWYLGYESAAYGIENQIDILEENVRLKSGLGEAVGHAAYRDRIKALPSDWQNAHLVKSSRIAIAADGSIGLEADIEYFNKGMLPDSAVRVADLTYKTQLSPTAGALPKFTSIEITQNSEGQADAIACAYGENRMRSLMHYWLALIESPVRNPEPVREILADGFLLNFSSGPISDFDGFKAWLAGPGSAMAVSAHLISEFRQEQTGKDEYKTGAQFDWHGIAPDGVRWEARTGHRWLVKDDPTARFARIKRMDVTVVKPFASLT